MPRVCEEQPQFVKQAKGLPPSLVAAMPRQGARDPRAYTHAIAVLHQDEMSNHTTTIMTLAAASSVMMLGVYRANHHNMTPEQQRDILYRTPSVITAKTITSPDDFEDALKCEKLILHFDVDWAIQAIQSRPVIVQLKNAIENNLQYQSVAIRRLDCTDQEGPTWEAVKVWLNQQKADESLMFTGAGAIAWVRSGKVVATVHDARHEGIEKLVFKTRLSMTSLP